MPINGEWKPGESRRCAGKKMMGQKQAELAAARVYEQDGHFLVAYRCIDCGQYHVGHADRTMKIVNGLAKP